MLNFDKVIFVIIVVISEYVYIWIQVKKKLVLNIYILVGQIAHSGALQPSSGKNYNFLILKVQFPQKWAKMLHQTMSNDPCYPHEWKLETWVFYKVNFTYVFCIISFINLT